MPHTEESKMKDIENLNTIIKEIESTCTKLMLHTILFPINKE